MTIARDALEWTLAWAAYWTWRALPLRTTGPSDWLLPSAGLYAFTEGGFAEYRRKRTGFMTCRSPDHQSAVAAAQSALERSAP